LPPLLDYQLNYPSIVVPRNITIHRTLTNVALGAEVYTVSITMHFYKPGDKSTFTVSAQYQADSEDAQGTCLVWESDSHSVSSPVFV
jgi:hypothetical protein